MSRCRWRYGQYLAQIISGSIDDDLGRAARRLGALHDRLNHTARRLVRIGFLQRDRAADEAVCLHRGKGRRHRSGLRQRSELGHLRGHFRVRLRLQRVLILHLGDQKLEEIVLRQCLLRP